MLTFWYACGALILLYVGLRILSVPAYTAEGITMAVLVCILMLDTFIEARYRRTNR